MVWVMVVSRRPPSVRALEHPGQEAADEIEIATALNARAREVLVELVEGRARQALGHAARVRDGAGPPQERQDPGHGGGGPFRPRKAEERRQGAPLGVGA